MNNLFKHEFENLNASEIKEIVNRCAGRDILEIDALKDVFQNNYASKYFIKYINDDKYGFWNIEWGWKRAEGMPMSTGTGFFQYRLKITPFKVEVENANGNGDNPFSKPISRKHLEEYLFVYINKKCPHYKQAIREETERFIKMIDFTSDEKIL